MRSTALVVLLPPILAAAKAAFAQADVKTRGQYVFQAGACDSCHTDHPNHDAFLAGGRPMGTPFGTFFVPNITPHRVAGIGDWTTRDMVRALRQAITPEGKPIRGPMAEYAAYGASLLSAEDLAAVAVYLRTIEPKTGLVAEPKERLDRRLMQQDKTQSGRNGAPGGGMGSELLFEIELRLAASRGVVSSGRPQPSAPRQRLQV